MVYIVRHIWYVGFEQNPEVFTSCVAAAYQITSGLLQNVLEVIEAVTDALKQMISQDIGNALKDSQDRTTSRSGKVKSIGDRLSLDFLFLSNSKRMNSLQRRCLYLSKEEYGTMTICKGMVGENRGLLAEI